LRAWSLSGVSRQHPEGNGSPTIVVALMMLPGNAMLEVPHVVTKTSGATGMSGLRPGAVAPDGTVASLKSGAATVLGSWVTGLPTKELVCVESAVLAREARSEAGSVIVAVGLQMLKIVEMPNGVVIGSGWTGGGEAVRPTEDDDEDINPPPAGDSIRPPLAGDDIRPPVVGAALAAPALVGPMIPVVGHVVIAPSDIPGIGLNTPR
jgi:hypothetical protein